MAIRDFFKANPEPTRERCLNDSEQILAWFEELARIGTGMDVDFQDSDILPIPGKTRLVGEESRSCTFLLQRPPRSEPVPGQRVHVVFPMDGQRFQGDLGYLGRGGYLEYQFSLPTSILHAERRSAVRVNFRSREKFHIVVLQSLFEGLGLSGELVDLSINGCRFLIQRAIRIQDERRVPINQELLAPGTPVSLVRLPNLPHLPLVECGGHVSHLRPGPRGMTMGIAFESVGSFENSILGKFLTERIPGFHRGFPVKRRFKDLTEEERLVAQPFGTPSDDEEEPASEPKDLELQDAIHDGDRLNKLRKRGKKILFVMADELDRTLLMAMFHQDGYRCLFEANSLIMALDFHRRLPLDLLVVDQAVGPHSAMQVIEALRGKDLPKTTPVVVIKREPDVRLVIAAKAGGISLLVDRPVDFPGTLQAGLERILAI